MVDDTNAESLVEQIPGQVYLVGGAVRDSLLGLPVSERDWVVVGATAEQMLNLGFRAVGRDFPVFLHPHTHEEYALARTERKTSPGHLGFAVHTAPDVTLEDDLTRRDLTINAIARDADGNHIDPCGGRQDLQQRLLRHITPAFAEDPLRVLRVARFAAQLSAFDFTLEPATRDMLSAMAASGELDTLVPERIWREFMRALASPRPATFISVLHDIGALAAVAPELAASLTGKVSQETLDALNRCAGNEQVAFAVLCHAIPEAPLRSLLDRLRVPKSFGEAALSVCRHRLALGDIQNSSDAVGLYEQLDALRRPDRLHVLTEAAMCIDPSQETLAQRLRRVLQVVLAVRASQLNLTGKNGKEIAGALREARLSAAQSAWHE